MKYPEENRMLVIRPCIKAICLQDKSASKLLAHLLYLARNADEDTNEFSISCTQDEIIEGLVDEIDKKTLHRTAVPMLRLLGFLEVDYSTYRYTYTLHLDLIQTALNVAHNRKQLDKLLFISMKQQIEKCPPELVKSLIDMDKCLIDMDKCLIAFRQMSNSKRGPKVKRGAAGKSVSKRSRYKEIVLDKGEEERSPFETQEESVPEEEQPTSSKIPEQPMNESVPISLPQYKTSQKHESKKIPQQQKIPLRIPHQGTVQEPRPQTRKEIEHQEEERRKKIWRCAETTLHKTFKSSFRQAKYNVEALNALLADYSDEQIKLGLESLNTQWERPNFTWAVLLKVIPNRLPDESPPAKTQERRKDSFQFDPHMNMQLVRMK